MFKNWNMKDLAFYYKENISVDEFSTFIAWVLYLRKNNEF